MVDFTVAICTYNGESRLLQVLERLRHQLDADQFNWEIIVVDNNSTDLTSEVVRKFQAIWPATHSLRYSFEPKQGLAYARQKAVEEATGNIIGFLDDDNLPTNDWLAAAYKFAQTHPQVGAYGSRIFGEFESKPPQDFQRIASLLALTERGAVAHCYEPNKKVLPPGAGLVVRRQVWLDHVPQQLVLDTKTGDRILYRGEDLEALLYIQRAGWEIWYNPEMEIYHQIPHSRLQKDYLMKLCSGIGLSRYHTRMLSVQNWQRPFACLAYMANDVRKIVVHLLRHRGAVASDIVAACELQLFIMSFLSPFYSLQNRYFWQKSEFLFQFKLKRSASLLLVLVILLLGVLASEKINLSSADYVKVFQPIVKI